MDITWILLMGQLKKTSLLLKDQKEGAFEKDLKARRLQNPEENMEESYRSLMRHSVQRQVTHSPKYWKDQYDDLLALVDAYGVPQFFLTLTADDCSQLRWEEYGSIEAFAKRAQLPLASWTGTRTAIAGMRAPPAGSPVGPSEGKRRATCSHHRSEVRA